MNTVETLIQYRQIAYTKFAEILGLLMLIWSVIDLLLPSDTIPMCCKVCVVVLIVAISIVVALCAVLKRQDVLELQINKRTKLVIKEEDMFAASKGAVCVIPVNEYFDTHLEDGIISKNTLHGTFLSFFENRIPQLRNDIDKQLDNITALPSNRKRTMVPDLPQRRYPLGTCVRIVDEERTYLLVAISRFNEYEHVEVAREEYPEIVRKMFNGIENLRDAKAVYMPLVGSGNSGYELTNMQILNTMVQAAYNANRLAVTEGMHICIYGKEIWNSLNLNVIEYLFDRWKSLK